MVVRSNGAETTMKVIYDKTTGERVVVIGEPKQKKAALPVSAPVSPPSETSSAYETYKPDQEEKPPVLTTGDTIVLEHPLPTPDILLQAAQMLLPQDYEGTLEEYCQLNPSSSIAYLCILHRNSTQRMLYTGFSEDLSEAIQFLTDKIDNHSNGQPGPTVIQLRTAVTLLSTVANQRVPDELYLTSIFGKGNNGLVAEVEPRKQGVAPATAKDATHMIVKVFSGPTAELLSQHMEEIRGIAKHDLPGWVSAQLALHRTYLSGSFTKKNEKGDDVTQTIALMEQERAVGTSFELWQPKDALEAEIVYFLIAKTIDQMHLHGIITPDSGGININVQNLQQFKQYLLSHHLQLDEYLKQIPQDHSEEENYYDLELHPILSYYDLDDAVITQPGNEPQYSVNILQGDYIYGKVPLLNPFLFLQEEAKISRNVARWADIHTIMVMMLRQFLSREKIYGDDNRLKRGYENVQLAADLRFPIEVPPLQHQILALKQKGIVNPEKLLFPNIVATMDAVSQVRQSDHYPLIAEDAYCDLRDEHWTSETMEKVLAAFTVFFEDYLAQLKNSLSHKPVRPPNPMEWYVNQVIQALQ